MTAGHRWLLKTGRLIHLVVSMLGMLSLLFFAVTGLLLNHEGDWFVLDDQVIAVTEPFPGEILREAKLAAGKKSAEIAAHAENGDTAVPVVSEADVKGAEYKIVAHLRATYDLRGEYRCEIDDQAVRVDFKAPGRSADATVEYEDSTLKLFQRSKGFLGRMLDLHRGQGKGSGWVWSLILDITCVVMVFLSATGLIIWSSLKTRRLIGLVALAGGVTVTVMVYLFWVP